MKTLDILKRFARVACAAALIAPLAVSVGCSDEQDEAGAPYLRLESTAEFDKTYVSNNSELGFNVKAIVGSATTSLIAYDIRSNMDWQIVNDKGEDADWLLVYPNEGSGDGKIRLCVKDNDTTGPRSTTLLFRFSNGRYSEATLVVNQASNAPYLTIKVDGKEATRAGAARDAATMEVVVATNVEFFYTKSDDSWFSFSENKNGNFTLAIDEFPTGVEELSREGSVTFRGVGEHSDLGGVLRVVQSLENFESATEITIEELLKTLPADGVVSQNCKITGYVVSDIANRNIAANQMVVQDASQRGVMFEFASAGENTYALGTKLSVWMMGKQIRKNAVKDLAALDNIFNPIAGSVPETVVRKITSFEECDALINTFVAIDKAEWVFPYGTYLAGDEASTANMYNSTSAGASTDHARLLRSSKGGSIRAYVYGGTKADPKENNGATFKHARLLPQGEGVVQGIVMTRPDDFEGTTDQTILRLRNADDDKIPATGTRGWSNIVEFVWPPFSQSGAVPIVPKEGAGTLKSSFATQWLFDGANAYIYAGYAYWRTDLATEAGGSSTYSGMNAKSWEGTREAESIFKGKYPEASVVKGEAWIASFSTKGITANEEVAIAFSTSSSATGPREFVVEWGEQGDLGTFHKIGNYDCTNWSALLYAPEQMFILPAECYGKDNVTIRLRVCGTKRANLAATSSAFASGGTNRLCAFSAFKRTK